MSLNASTLEGSAYQSSTNFYEDGRVMEIRNVRFMSDSAMYQCAASNQYGVIYSSAELRVRGEQWYNPVGKTSSKTCCHHRAHTHDNTC